MNRNILNKKRIRILALILAVALIVLSGCGGETAGEAPLTDNPEIAAETSEEGITETTAPETTEETTEELTEETTEEETEEETEEPLPEEPIQFMFFGCDTVGYTEWDKGRSDAIKVIQFNPKDRSIRVVSILRDSKVPIGEYSPQKINAAYMLGGAELAMQTVNENFGLDIHDYIMIDFSQLVQLIDRIGGVDVEITQDEADIINENDGDYVGDGRPTYSQPVSAGLAHLDGSQTLAYSRIRYIDSDYFRAERQNNVLWAIIQKLKETPASEYEPIMVEFFWKSETSLSYEDVLVWTKLGLEKYWFSTMIVPDPDIDEWVEGGLDETESWVWQYDIPAAGENIRKFLSTGEKWWDDETGDLASAKEQKTKPDEPETTSGEEETTPGEK